MQDLLEAWGEEIAKLLKEQGKSYFWLADVCDVHQTTIWRIIKGKLNPNDELKWKIAGALGERMDVLWGWPRVVPPSPTAEAVA